MIDQPTRMHLENIELASYGLSALSAVLREINTDIDFDGELPTWYENRYVTGGLLAAAEALAHKIQGDAEWLLKHAGEVQP